jgi:anti-sigma regulatory factor (Ser/Thr protein kinase)
VTAQMVLPTVAASAGAARRLVTEAVRDAGAPSLAETAQLLVSEVVTNAVLHATGHVRVEVSCLGGRLRVRVGDDSSALPERRNHAEDATTGRGLVLIEALSSAWGVEVDGDGKTVWFELSEEDAS